MARQHRLAGRDILGIVSAAMPVSDYYGIDSAALTAKVGVGAWADIFLHVAIVSTVGLIVLTGVRASLPSRD